MARSECALNSVIVFVDQNAFVVSFVSFCFPFVCLAIEDVSELSHVCVLTRMPYYHKVFEGIQRAVIKSRILINQI